ncbi:MAG: ligase-associated DNA damage response endonuclease PdeM [Hyphomicrobiaceae bacterium]
MSVLTLSPERVRVSDAAALPLSICGKQLLADRSGALYWPGERTLIVADLHLEKASAQAERGVLLPPYDTRETLERLAVVIERYNPATVVALGDSLHDRGAAERIAAGDLAALRILQEDRRWIWVTGNHDPEIGRQLGGEVVDALTRSGLRLVHLPTGGRTTHEIAGHLHPAARVSLYGHTLRRPCFVGNRLRLVLPAFGTFTGGLNVLDPAFLPLFGHDGFGVWMLGQEGVYPVATRQLYGD